MACSDLLFHNPSSRSLRLNRHSAYSLTSIRRYSFDRAEKGKQWGGNGAEKAERVREIKGGVREAEGSKKARQGFGSQTIEKESDGTEETVLGESRVETVEERYKEPVGKGNFHKPRDEYKKRV